MLLKLKQEFAVCRRKGNMMINNKIAQCIEQEKENSRELYKKWSSLVDGKSFTEDNVADDLLMSYHIIK